MARAHAVVVALHASAFARNHGDADAVRCSTVVAEKTFTGSQSNFAAAKTCAATFRIHDSWHRHRGTFDGFRPLDQNFGRWLAGVLQVKLRPGLCKSVGGSEAREL